MEIAALWIGFSILVGLFASQRRNRSGVGWFLLALLVSPFLAILAALIVKPLSAEDLARRSTPLQPRSSEELRRNRVAFAWGLGLIVFFGAAFVLASLLGG